MSSFLPLEVHIYVYMQRDDFLLTRFDFGQHGAGTVRRLWTVPVYAAAGEEQVQTGTHYVPNGHSELRDMRGELWVHPTQIKHIIDHYV